MAAQAHGVGERTGLTESQTGRAVWTVSDDARVTATVGGPRAVGLFLAVAWSSKLPLLAWKLPGAPLVLDLVYGWIARHRHRLPGQTPWCVDHPHACEPEPVHGP